MGKVMKFIDQCITCIENGIALVTLLSATAVLIINVILRYFFGAGFSWAEEFIRYSLIVGAFFGGAIAVREKSHVAMTILLEVVKNPRIKRIYSVIINLVTVLFCLRIVLWGCTQVQFVYEMGQSSAAMRIPMFIPYLSVPIGFAFMAIRTVEHMVRTVIHFNDGEEGEEA